MRTRAEALEDGSACSGARRRRPYRRAKRFQPREKERIVAERAFENVQLNYEDVAEFEYFLTVIK